VRFEIGPRASERKISSARGGKEHGKRLDLGGIYRTPLTPRDHPNPRADFRIVRACIERRNGVLRRYSALTIATWSDWLNATDKKRPAPKAVGPRSAA
jgi:hypothetical protein